MRVVFEVHGKLDNLAIGNGEGAAWIVTNPAGNEANTVGSSADGIFDADIGGGRQRS
jgi:hypothetical protein